MRFLRTSVDVNRPRTSLRSPGCSPRVLSSRPTSRDSVVRSRPRRSVFPRHRFASSCKVISDKAFAVLLCLLVYGSVMTTRDRTFDSKWLDIQRFLTYIGLSVSRFGWHLISYSGIRGNWMNLYDRSYRCLVAFSLAAAFLSASIGLAQNVVQIGDATGAACDTGIRIAVSLTNAVPVESFEFWIEFDDSVLVATRVEPAARTTDFDFNGIVDLDNWLWFEGVSPPGEPLAPGEGPIAYLVFNVDCDADVDEYTTIRFIVDSCAVFDTLGNPVADLEFQEGIFTVETGIWTEPYHRELFVQPYARGYPNPFRRTTIIAFALPSSGSEEHVMVDIFDSTGRWITGDELSVQNGRGSFDWQGTDSRGFLVPAGVYICTIRSAESKSSMESVSTRVILLR